MIAARTAVDQIIDLRITLRSMGVPIDGKAWLFGDNQSVLQSSTIPPFETTEKVARAELPQDSRCCRKWNIELCEDRK